MRNFVKIAALIGIFYSNSVLSHTFTFNQCLDVTEWITTTIGARDQNIPYEQIEEAIRNHMDAIRIVKPEKAFVLDPADDEAFFSLLEKVYHSKRSIDEEQTDYLTDCVSRITPN